MNRSLFPLLLIALLMAGCAVPGSDPAQSGAVVQGSTAAPTEPAATATPVSVGIAETPTVPVTMPVTVTLTATDTPVSPATATPAPATDTPVPPATATSAPPATPTAGPTLAPTATPTGGASATPTASPTAPSTPAPTATPYPKGVFVASHRGYAEGSNYVVVGEVLNTAGYPVYGARIIANFYDSSDRAVAAGQAMTSLAMTEPEVGNPFKLKVENVASSVSRYELSVAWEDVSLIEFRHLTVVEGEVRQGEVVGRMRNDHESTLTSIVVAVTFYDASGAVVDTADIFLGGQKIAPGETLPFAIPISASNLVYERFWIEAQGNLELF